MKLILVNSMSDEEITLDAKLPIIIGRGPLFGCVDKRVSRKHCQMQFTQDGNIHIVALHSNPCFFMKKGTPPVHHITKNEDQILNDGDYFGLLPDSFWYKIVIKIDEMNNTSIVIPINEKNDTFSNHKTEEIVSDCTNKIKNNEDNNKKEIEQHNTSTIKLAEGTESEISENVKSDIMNSTNSILSEKLKALEKTQKLPLWMYEIDDIPKELQNMEKRSFSSNSPKIVEERTIPESENFNNSENSITIVKEDSTLTTKNESNETKTENIEAPNECVVLKNSIMSSNSDGTIAETSQEKIVKNNNSKKENANPATSKRPICQYEGNCYRKNELHKQEFCHPGDSDFVNYKNRPICQYGSSCYRRNKTHWVEYQHPKKNSPFKTRKKNNVGASPPQKRHRRTVNYKSSEEDDYDLEDPFIDDASSDEYIPSDLTSEEDFDDMNLSS